VVSVYIVAAYPGRDHAMKADDPRLEASRKELFERFGHRPREAISRLAPRGQGCGFQYRPQAVIPSALAVCRLMTNSNLVDCTTGRSAALRVNTRGMPASERFHTRPSNRWQAGRGTRRVSFDVVYGELGLLRLERLPRTALPCASR
jgi:hypothetical protein